MELTPDLTAEQVHFYKEQEILSEIAQQAKDEAKDTSVLSEQTLFERLQNILLEKIKKGNKEAYFQLGLLLFEQGCFEKSRSYFRQSRDFDLQSLYQLSVMMYDGIGGEADTVTAVEYMKLLSKSPARSAKHLLPAVFFNIGRAYFQGFGVKQSDIEAERWWLMAADDGNPQGSIKAQCILGMFYSRSESRDLDKAFFWHSEACGNGSLESQGALGVMYLNGIGVKQNIDAAYICLKDATDRGNIYAMGNLICLFYQNKLFTKCADLASKVSMLDDLELIVQETDCLSAYIKKGISMACFFLARCLHQGRGIKQDSRRAREFYSRSFEFDTDTCARLQNLTQHGDI